MNTKLFLFAISLLAGACACGKGSHGGNGNYSTVVPDTTFKNPLLSGGPDPWVIQSDTNYFYTHTMGDHIAIYKTSKMSALSQAAPVTIWTPPASGPYSKEIWAPELHQFNNKWFMYFAADDGNNDNHRIYALENDDADPLSANWTFKGKIADDSDHWAIDASTFQYNNKLYMIWSGWPGEVNGEQDIYIAEMATPLSLKSSRIKISTPTYSWETSGAPPIINEGPEALINPSGRLFLTFSGSACWTDNYCLGLLTLKAGGDPLNPSDWTKSANPVFSTSTSGNAYAPGHNGFFVSRDGKQNWILYHANSTAGAGCGNARSPRIQQFTWNPDGTPNFGTPVATGGSITKPGGEY